jgi:hypothetical protein
VRDKILPSIKRQFLHRVLLTAGKKFKLINFNPHPLTSKLEISINQFINFHPTLTHLVALEERCNQLKDNFCIEVT